MTACPVVPKSKRRLLHILKLTPAQCDHLIDHSSTYYKPFVDGNGRAIDNPVDLLKVVQRRLLRTFLDHVPPSPIAFGAIRGRSHVEAARLHCGAAFLGGLDIARFFPSITPTHVYSAWTDLGASPDVARILTRLTTIDGYLPQGSPVSPALSNIVLRVFDDRAISLASVCETQVSRYIDDVQVSGPSSLAVQRTLEALIAAASSLGFRPKRSKVRLGPATSVRRVLGLDVTTQVRSSRAYRRRVRDQIRLYGAGAMVDLNMLRGKIAYVARFSHSQGRSLLRELQDQGARRRQSTD